MLHHLPITPSKRTSLNVYEADIFNCFRQVLARFWSTALPTAPGGVGLAPRGHVTPPETPFFQPISQTLLPPHRFTETCSAPQAAYPAGDGSVTILRSMPPNNRRVRWLSARSSQ